MKKLCCAALLCLPLNALAYHIDVEKTLNGAEVSYDTQEISADTGAIVLVNQGLSAARCTAVFRAGPDTPKTRRVVLQSGEKIMLSARFPRDIIRLRVRLECGLID